MVSAQVLIDLPSTVRIATAHPFADYIEHRRVGREDIAIPAVYAAIYSGRQNGFVTCSSIHATIVTAI